MKSISVKRILKTRAELIRKYGVFGYAKRLLRRARDYASRSWRLLPHRLIGTEDWHSPNLSQVILKLSGELAHIDEARIFVPKFAMERSESREPVSTENCRIFFLVDTAGESEDLVEETVISLQNLSVGAVVCYTWDPHAGFKGQVRNRSGKEDFDPQSVCPDDLVYLLRPGERVLQRAVLEHASSGPHDWDLVFGPFCGEFGMIEFGHSATQPAAIRGHVWRALLDIASDAKLDSLGKRNQTKREFAARRYRPYYCPIPCLKGRKIWKERIPDFAWFVQEYVIGCYTGGGKLFNCHGTSIESLITVEKRRLAVNTFRRDGLKAVRLVSARIDKIFSERMRDEVATYFLREHQIESSFSTPDKLDELEAGEILILLVHQCADEKALLKRIRAQKNRGIIISWFWDNHHLAPLNLETALLSDAVCAGHSFIADYLEVDGVEVLPPVPLCVTQWTCSEARRYFRWPQATERNIVGGFVEYEKACERNKLVSIFQNALPKGKVELFPYEKGVGYFSLSIQERFLDWKSYSASLCIPLFFDLSQRYFDSLLTGQIPLLVGRMPDLERLLGEDGPERGWTVYHPNSADVGVGSAAELAEAAMRLHESCGETGSRERHDYTLANHMFVHRIEAILSHWIKGQKQSLPKSFEGARQRVRERRTVIDVQHGLGNRMRAYASARVLADGRGGDFELVWKPDHHCEATFGELFENDEVILNAVPVAGSDWAFYNLVDLEQTPNWQDPVDLDNTRNILIKSQRCLRFAVDRREEENEVLRMLRPSETVRAKMAGIPDLSQCVGIHVRMEGGEETSKASYDKPEQWDEKGREAMFHWRSKSHWTRFVGEMKRLVATEPGIRFFLASDQDFVISRMREEFGDRIISIQRAHFDRSSEQIAEGLADIFLLSQCRSILASNWSSFSEMAIRIGGREAKYAGIDF